MIRPRLLVPAGAFAALVACGAASQNRASDAQLEAGRDRARVGSALFASRCATCHGDRGQGSADAPQILGPGALPEYARERSPSGMPWLRDPEQMQIDSQTHHGGLPLRSPFRNAQDLYTYVASHLSKSDANGLVAQDYRAIVTFMLIVQGAALPVEGLTEDNAASVAIPH